MMMRTLGSRVRRSASLQTFATAPRAAGRALQRLPFAVKVALAALVLCLASLVAIWLNDAGFRDRLYRAVTGYRRPPDARFELARGGRCVDGCASGGVEKGGCIPRDVHVTYSSRGVLRHHRILESALAPGYRFHYYSDEQAERYVAENCSAYYDAYDCFLPTAYKADVFRYCVMLREGGLYMDNDFALLVHPEPYLMDAACGGVYLLAEYCENYGKAVRLWTGIMISGKGMPVWQCMLDRVKANVLTRFYGRNALEVTGPELLAKCARDHPEFIHPVGWNEKDGTMWLYPERRDDGVGVPLQIGHEIGTKYKDESQWKPPLHYHAQWLNKEVYSDHCKL